MVRADCSHPHGRPLSLIDGADAGPRDFSTRRTAGQTDIHHGCDREIRYHRYLGPERRATLQKVVEIRTALGETSVHGDQAVGIGGKDVCFRISYVGEQGWELHMRYEDGSRLGRRSRPA